MFTLQEDHRLNALKRAFYGRRPAMGHEYCRSYLREVTKDVRENVSKKIIKNAWAYKYDGENVVEFHINKCNELPEGYYWSGRGCCRWIALADGWRHFLDKD